MPLKANQKGFLPYVNSQHDYLVSRGDASATTTAAADSSSKNNLSSLCVFVCDRRIGLRQQHARVIMTRLLVNLQRHGVVAWVSTDD
ncbi:hypothetical protein TSMEX_008560 [Taenia solium]|eukprot:TsM_000804300 transcript=TsM_000804300 gene=TsM_000804300